MNYFSNLIFLAFLLIISTSSQAKNTLSPDGQKKSLHHKSRPSHHHVPVEEKSTLLSRQKEQSALYYKSRPSHHHVPIEEKSTLPSHEKEQSALYYKSLSSRVDSKTHKDSTSSLMKVHYMEDSSNNELSDQIPYHYGNSTVEVIERKNGLIYFKLGSLGISNDSDQDHKSAKENPDIIWTLPESSNIENGTVLPLHTFRDPDALDDPRKEAPDDTKGFYVPYYEPPVKQNKIEK